MLINLFVLNIQAGNRKRTDSYNFLSIAKKEAIEGNEQDVQRLLASCPEDSKEVRLHYGYFVKQLFLFTDSIGRSKECEFSKL